MNKYIQIRKKDIKEILITLGILMALLFISIGREIVIIVFTLITIILLINLIRLIIRLAYRIIKGDK